MYVDNLVTGFYNVIAKQRVLIFVHYDIDAICAAKILQTIFRHDAVSYTLIPITTVSDLISAYQEHKQDIKYVILINCGGTIDVVENLEPEEHVVFFIADSHRPTDVCNIYSLNDQIRILCKAEPEEKVPEFYDIFKDDDDDDESSDIDEEFSDDDNVNTENRAAKRLRLDEQVINKRAWEKNRRRILFEYMQFSYCSRSAAILMYELSWQLHRDHVDLLWWGIIGVVEQFILNKVEILQYLNEVEKISAHIGRLCPNIQDNVDNFSQNSFISSQQNNTTPALRINCEKDLQLALYRHWTVESSLKYTMFTAVALKLWAIKGEKRLHQLLAEMGLPLAESRQQYYSMDLTLRKEFHNMIEKLSDSRNLTHLTYPSFTLLQGFRTKYQAADYVYSLLALLSNNVCGEMSDIFHWWVLNNERSKEKNRFKEQVMQLFSHECSGENGNAKNDHEFIEYETRGKSIRDCFYDAMDALSRSKKDLLNDGIEKSKKFLTIMFKQVQNALDMKQIILAGPFYYFVIQEGTLNARYYSNPDCLWLIATFALRAYVAASRKSRAARLPLIASAPLEEGYCLLVGVPPVAETMPRSFFGKAFEQVAEKTGCMLKADYFDSTAVKIQIADRPKIFDGLAVLLS